VLRAFGLVGLGIGIAAIGAGSVAGDVGGFVTGYGLLVILSSGYLLLGLALRAFVQRRSTLSTHRTPVLDHH
jgi:hypothetical protein